MSEIWEIVCDFGRHLSLSLPSAIYSYLAFSADNFIFIILKISCHVYSCLPLIVDGRVQISVWSDQILPKTLTSLIDWLRTANQVSIWLVFPGEVESEIKSEIG